MSLIKIEDVAHVRFRAPDLGEMQSYLEQFGLQVVSADGHRLFMRGRGGAPFVHATELGEPDFAGIGLRAESVADLEVLAAAEGVPVEPLDARRRRVAGTIAAGVGAMRGTEQIDAMRTLSTDPFRYLVAPRLVAGIVTLPILTGVADIIGIAGGWLVSTLTLDFNPAVYARATVDFVEAWDVQSGLIKAAVFGFIVTLMGCYHGYTAIGGARGVGRAATRAMVWSGVLIFATDYALTTLFTHA